MHDEIKELVIEQGQAFASFKAASDEKIKNLETVIFDLAKKSNRPSAPGFGNAHFGAEQKAAVDSFIRRGDASGLDTKSMNTTAGTDGGYTVPKEMAVEIYSQMTTASPMRSVCNVVPATSGNYVEVVCSHGGGVTHAGEEDARPATATPAFPEVTPSLGEAYVNWPVSQRLLDDSAYDLVAFLLQEAPSSIGVAQNNAFTVGNGTNKAKGFLSYTQASTDDAARAFGTVQYVPTGSAGNFKTASATVSPSDDLITMVYKMKAGLRPGAGWMMNAATLAVVSKWKDLDGNNIWTRGIQAGQPSSLLGFPVFENEDMPSIGSGTTPIAFGNWKRAYTIVDRTLTFLRDPYTNKPFVNIYLNAYYGGMLRDSEAVKLLKLSAS